MRTIVLTEEEARAADAVLRGWVEPGWDKQAYAGKRRVFMVWRVIHKLDHARPSDDA